MKQVATLCLLLVLAGCVSQAEQDRQLAEVYRPGMSRTGVRALFATAPLASRERPGAGWTGVGELPERVEAFAGEYERTHGVVVQVCDVYTVPRGFLGFGIYFDYLYFGADGTLLGCHRRSVD